MHAMKLSNVYTHKMHPHFFSRLIHLHTFSSWIIIKSEIKALLHLRYFLWVLCKTPQIFTAHELYSLERMLQIARLMNILSFKAGKKTRTIRGNTAMATESMIVAFDAKPRICMQFWFVCFVAASVGNKQSPFQLLKWFHYVHIVHIASDRPL